MSTTSLGIEQPKTECPMCGNVWQRHTLNEIDGCMAILHLEFSVALARSGKRGATSPTVEPCPVCNKLPAEHAETDLTSCMTKWRKRPKGATGLQLQHSFLEGHFEYEEPDPVKRAQMNARMLQSRCFCGKTRGDHTVNEIRACAERNRPKRW
jgi:hypothetical protein